MKKQLMILTVLASVAAFSDPNPYADYGAAMKSDDKNPSAVDWSKKFGADIKNATSDDAIAMAIADESGAKALLAAIKPAYGICPVAATKIAAVTQWVMLPDPWYCFLWGGKHEAGRRVWTAALLDTMRNAKCDYVRRFCADQLRWCGYPEQLKEIDFIFTGHGYVN